VNRRARAGALLLAATPLAACATVDGGPRAALSSVGCARAAVAEVVAPGMPDARAHCLGAARIARRCSVAEARMAAYAKEIADALGDGDAELRDLAADRAGIACARARATDVAACCATAGF
jgi:hypothetical protein